MVYLLTGRAGSGKTSYIIEKLKSDMENKRKAVLIVPEQQALSAERILSQRLGNKYNLYIEVQNFDRLPGRIFREYGYSIPSYANETIKVMIMALALEKTLGNLKYYNNVSQRAEFVKNSIEITSRFKNAGYTPEKLKSLLADIDDREKAKPLFTKLADLTLIYKEYTELLSTEFIDPLDSISILTNFLNKTKFFTHTNVYVDGFFNFTEQELNLLNLITTQSPQVYISLTYDPGEASLFPDSSNVIRRLNHIMSTKPEEIYFGATKWGKGAEIRAIEKGIWSANKGSPVKNENSKVKILRAQDIFDETEAAASYIMFLVREKGLRYRDISIVSNNIDEYEGFLDIVFEKNNIPYFLSKKESVIHKALFNHLLSALEVIISDFGVKQVKQFLSCDFLPFDEIEADVLATYIDTWKIKGWNRYFNNEWKLNPEGYSKSFSSFGYVTLNRANSAKNILAKSIYNLKQVFDKKSSVSDVVLAVYSYLEDNKINKKQEARISLLQEHSIEEAQKENQLWEILVEILDNFSLVFKDKVLTAKRFFEIFKLMIENRQVGSIPSSVDQVKVSDSTTFRADSYKAQMFLGVNDGVFPAYSKGDSFFTEDEILMLEERQLGIAIPKAYSHNRQRFYFYNCLAAARDYLYFSYLSRDSLGEQLRASYAIDSIKKLVVVQEEDFGLDESDYLYSVESTKAFYPFIKNKALKEYIKTNLNIKPSTVSDRISLFDKSSTINFTQDTVYLSAGKLSLYENCPFAYFAKHVLQLRSTTKPGLNEGEAGNIIHHVLEAYFREKFSTHQFIKSESEEVRTKANTITVNYVKDILGDSDELNSRNKAYIDNIVDLLVTAIERLEEEFLQSGFRPIEFELTFGNGEKDEIKTKPVPIKDEKQYILRGAVDRIDVLELHNSTFVRVVDYKTGDKNLNRESLEEEWDYQTLAYLSVYCMESPERIPAGALYMQIKNDFNKIEPKSSKYKIVPGIKVTGILLDEKDILTAMDSSQEGVYIPVRYKKDGGFHKTYLKNLAGREDFGNILTETNQKIKVIAENIVDGHMQIDPMVKGKKDPCIYCDYKEFCRIQKTKA